MRNQDAWKETKFVLRNGRLRASPNPKEMNVSSRLIADIIAGKYQTALAEHATGWLLDLGCGKVPLYGVYKAHVTDATCVDWANTLHKNEYLDQEVDLTGPLPFADEAFDTIILSDVLEHIPVPERLCSEIARILRPGGKLIMNVPFFYWLHEQPHDYYRYTEFALRRFMDVSGMKLVSLAPIGGAPEIVTDITAKCVVHVPVLGRPVASLIQSLCLWFVRTRLGRKASAATARAFPLGYFLIAQKPAG